jgi:cytochrome b involved in lipid metabolism
MIAHKVTRSVYKRRGESQLRKFSFLSTFLYQIDDSSIACIHLSYRTIQITNFSPTKQHTFPHDFRNGPSPYDWDPSKWFIYLLYTYTPFVTSIKRAREQDVNNSLEYMKAKVSGKGTDSGYSSFNEEPGEIWGIEEVERYVREKGRACTLVAIDGWVVDVTGYMKQHVSIFLPDTFFLLH